MHRTLEARGEGVIPNADVGEESRVADHLVLFDGHAGHRQRERFGFVINICTQRLMGTRWMVTRPRRLRRPYVPPARSSPYFHSLETPRSMEARG